jgi:hypothetical protein
VPPADRDAIKEALTKHGVPVTDKEIAKWYLKGQQSRAASGVSSAGETESRHDRPSEWSVILRNHEIFKEEFPGLFKEALKENGGLWSASMRLYEGELNTLDMKIPPSTRRLIGAELSKQLGREPSSVEVLKTYGRMLEVKNWQGRRMRPQTEETAP